MRDNITKASTEASGLKKTTDKLRLHDGLSGPLKFPESTPLVFPELDRVASNGNPEQTKKIGKYLKFRKLVAEYYDRRAQAEYVSRIDPQRPPFSPDMVCAGLQESREPSCGTTSARLCIEVRRPKRFHEPLAHLPGHRRSGPVQHDRLLRSRPRPPQDCDCKSIV